MLTKTWYKVQASSYSLEWLFQPSRLAKFDSLLIRVCAIVAFIGYREITLLTFLEFSLLFRILSIVFHPWNLCLSLQPFPQWYSRISGEPLVPLFCPLVNRACIVPITQQVLFLVFSSFSSFSFDFFESLWLATCFGTCWGHALLDPVSLAILLFYPFYSDGRNLILPIWNSFTIIPFFKLLHSGSPRRFPLAPWGRWFFLLFLQCHLALMASTLFLIFFLSFSFKLS